MVMVFLSIFCVYTGAWLPPSLHFSVLQSGKTTVLSSNPKVFALNPQVWVLNPRVLALNPKVFTVYPRVYNPRHFSTSYQQTNTSPATQPSQNKKPTTQ